MKENEVFGENFENAERIGYLIAAYIKGTLTPLERKELDEWILESPKNEILFDELASDEHIEKTMQWYASLDEGKRFERVKKRIRFTPGRRKVSFPFIAVAASLIIVAGLALLFTWNKGALKSKDTPQAITTDVLPQYNKAVLTLGDGGRITLDSTAPGSLDSGAIKISAGSIAYDTLTSGVAKENLLTVPPGGQFAVTLGDGTKVWLNAASSLSYTTSFTVGERRVRLSGEGYFEVAKNKEKPFIVEFPGGTVKVLGTHFNINSYGDEGSVRATLLEGSVEVSGKGEKRVLKPGQQARLSANEVSVVAVDAQKEAAWKNGEFVFRNSSLLSIARQLGRWYDLEPEFRDPVEKHINATIKRDAPLSRVLHYLEETGEVHFKVEGKKLVVTN